MDPDTLRLRVGFDLVYDLSAPTPILFVLDPPDLPGQRLVSARRDLAPGLPLGAFRTYVDLYGNRVWRVAAPQGELRLTHDVVVDVPRATDPVLPHLGGTPVEDLPDDVIVYTLPSRYCPSDLLVGEAWDRFGHVAPGWARVQAVCDHLQREVEYGAGSNASTTALEAYAARRGVCRDFAHLGVTFCRALSIPARYVSGYLPDYGIAPTDTPMDFHAWFEAWIGGAWRTFDARHNVPRAGRVRIATGRDAADVAIATTYGAASLRSLWVWADEDGTGAGGPGAGRTDGAG